jgi:pimeloyl-ACP methyl ester carboxylesterase
MAGEDAPFVFVHGFGASSAPYFAEVAGAAGIRSRRRVLVDLLGFGLSDRPENFSYEMPAHADTLARCLRALEVSAAHVVAHSMGGAVAVHLTSQYPDLVSALTLLEPVLEPSDCPTGLRAAVARYSEEEFIVVGLGEFLDWAGSTWSATLRWASPRALHRSALSLHDTTSPGTRQMLRDLPLPRQLLVGGDSPAYPAYDGLAASGVDMVSVPDAGHNISLENPAVTAEVLGEFAALTSPVKQMTAGPKSGRAATR